MPGILFPFGNIRLQAGTGGACRKAAETEYQLLIIQIIIDKNPFLFAESPEKMVEISFRRHPVYGADPK